MEQQEEQEQLEVQQVEQQEEQDQLEAQQVEQQEEQVDQFFLLELIQGAKDRLLKQD